MFTFDTFVLLAFMKTRNPTKGVTLMRTQTGLLATPDYLCLNVHQMNSQAFLKHNAP